MNIDEREINKWFMEMYIDSSDWVMVPNVFGMATYSDGGLMSTKPYTCGSNYILKMSNYKKGDWCDIVDGLYWRFTEKNIDFYKSNPRLSFLHRTLDRMSEDRKSYIFKRAEDFISQNTKWSRKRFVKYVKNHFRGEKNGKKIGKMLFIAVKDVGEVKIKLRFNFMCKRISSKTI